MEIFNQKQLYFKRKIVKLVGADIDIMTVGDERKLGFIKMKAFKLKEDIRIFTDKSMTKQLMVIKARQILDIAATYDVYEGSEKDIMFSLKRKGISSTFARDKWYVLDTDENIIAVMKESGIFALLRRYMLFIPYVGIAFDVMFAFVKVHYKVHSMSNNKQSEFLGEITRQKNPVVVKFISDTTHAEAESDPHLFPALGAILSVIEFIKD